MEKSRSRESFVQSTYTPVCAWCRGLTFVQLEGASRYLRARTLVRIQPRFRCVISCQTFPIRHLASGLPYPSRASRLWSGYLWRAAIPTRCRTFRSAASYTAGSSVAASQ